MNFTLKKYRSHIILSLITVFALLIRLYNVEGAPILWDGAIYAFAATQILKGYTWWSPYWYHPPLLMYLIAISFLILGVNEFAARVPSILMGTLLVPICYILGKDLYDDENVGLLSAFFIAFSFYFVKFSRKPLMEISISLFLSLAVYYAYKASS